MPGEGEEAEGMGEGETVAVVVAGVKVGSVGVGLVGLAEAADLHSSGCNQQSTCDLSCHGVWGVAGCRVCRVRV